MYLIISFGPRDSPRVGALCSKDDLETRIEMKSGLSVAQQGAKSSQPEYLEKRVAVKQRTRQQAPPYFFFLSAFCLSVGSPVLQPICTLTIFVYVLWALVRK